MGPTFAGEYPKDDHTNGHPSGYLRRTFKLFANVRPVRSWRQLNPLIPDAVLGRGGEGRLLARKRPGSRAGKGLLTEAGLKSPIFYSKDIAIDGAAILEKLSAMQMEGIVSKNVEAPYRSGRNESWLKINSVQGAKFPIVGFVKDPRRRGAAFRQAGGEGLRLCQVGTGFNRKSSMEIRKKLDAIVSSKSRLGKDPRLKGASWVLRADR